MKIKPRPSIALLSCMGLLAALAAPHARADVGPPVDIRMPADTPPAASGQEYAGVFEVHLFKAGLLADFALDGEGWKILAFDPPNAPAEFQPGVYRIPFRAMPQNADSPIGLTLTYNGRRARQAYEVGPSYFARRGRPLSVFVLHADGSVAPFDPTAASQPQEVSEASDHGPRGGEDTLRVTGRFVYNRPGRDLSDPPDGDFDDPGDRPPIAVGVDHLDVRLWDNDDVGHDELWSGHTDENGYFDTGVLTPESDPGGPDLVLYFETETAVVDVTNNDITEDTYWGETDEILDYTAATYNYGTLTVESAYRPAFHIYNSIIRTNRFIAEKPGYTVPSVQVEWPDDSRGDKAWYEDHSNEIHISSFREWRNDTASHEYGHHFIDSAYEPDMPESEYCIDPSCDPDPPDDCGHCQWCQETDHDAWNEGWPNWLADVVTRDYQDRYTHDVDGPAFVPLYTRSQEWPRTCSDSSMFEDPVKTEGFIGALLRDIDDQTLDDHDDDPDPDATSFDGVFDLMCLGPNEIFYITATYQPVTILEFIDAFLTEYPQHTDLLWPTAFNVGGEPYVANFPTDFQPPGVVPDCDSPTHPLGLGGPFPCMTFDWVPAPDDVRGANTYSYVVTQDPSGEDPPETPMFVGGNGACRLTTTVPVSVDLGLYYFSIKARDNAGNWGPYTTFGPFEITDCNGTGILDLCDISCNHTGIPDFCSMAPGVCDDQPGCDASADCQPNFIPDECDIASGNSEDCNQNGMPDECEDMSHWGGGDGSWQTAANWVENQVPAPGFHVCINDPGDDITVTYQFGASEIGQLACYESLNIQPPSSPATDATLTIDEGGFIQGDLMLNQTGYVTNDVTLINNDLLTVDGALNWSSGWLRGPGTTSVSGGMSILTIGGLDEQTLELYGPTVSMHRLLVANNAVIHNNVGAEWDHQVDIAVVSQTGGIFVNDGTFTKSAGAGSSEIGCRIENSGEVRIDSGTLVWWNTSETTGDVIGAPGTTFTLRCGGHEFLPGSSIVVDKMLFSGGTCGTTTIHGTYNATTETTQNSGSTVTFAGDASIVSYGESFYIPKGLVNFDAVVGSTISFDTFSLGSPISVAGTAHFNGGDDLQVTNLIIGPGTITGTGDITVDGLLTWRAFGHIQGPGALDVNGDMIVEAGGGSKTLDNRILNNAGTATFLGPLGLLSSAVINNLASGVIDIQADSGATIIGGSGVGNNLLDNVGTIVKTAGPGTSTISAPTLNHGTVEIQIGVLEFYTSYGAYYTQTAGQTILNGGDLHMFGPAPVQIDGGLLTGAGTISGVVQNDGGTVAPGQSAGALAITESYAQGAGGTLAIELAGPTPGTEHDVLEVTGTANLDGELQFELIDGYIPAPGQEFVILTAASVTGTFSAVPPPDLFTVTYYADNVTLTALTFGDLDGDGDVDIDDFSIFAGCMSGPGLAYPGGCDAADFNGDGDVDLHDFADYQTLFQP